MSDAASKEARRQRLLGLPASDEPVATPVAEPTVEPVVEPVAEAAPAPSGQSRRDRLLGLKPEPVVAEAAPAPLGQSRRDRLLGLKPEPVVAAKPAPVVAVAAPAPVRVAPAPVRVAPSAPKVADPVVVVKKAGPKPVAVPYEGDPAMPWGYYEQIDKGATPEAAQFYVDALPTFGTLQGIANSQPKSSTVGEPGTPTGPVYGPPEREMERAVLPKLTAAELEAIKAIGTGGLPLPHTNPVVALLARTLFKDQVEPVQKKFAQELMPLPEAKVKLAARNTDVRARAEKLINDVGLRNAMGVPEDAPLADLGLALVNASDPQYERYYRYRLSKADGRRPDGQKFEDLPKDEAEEERAKVRKDAMVDLALLKTVNMWGPKGFMPADRDPTSVIDALKPTAEVIGVNDDGEVVTRVQSLLSWGPDALGIVEYLPVATGMPSALLRGMFGENPEADQPTYDYGQIAGITVPFSPESLRERRGYLQAKGEADPKGAARRLYRSAGEAIGAPDAVVDTAEYVAGEAADWTVGTSAFIASLVTPDPISMGYKGLKGLGVAIGLTRAEKLALEGKKAVLVAEKSAKESADFGGLIARNASESEVVERIEQGAKVADEMVKPLTQSAKDAVADSARVRVHAEKAAVEAEAAERAGRQGVLYSEGGAGARSAAEVSADDAAALAEISAYNKTIREVPVGKVNLNRNQPMPGNIPYQPKNHYRVVGKEGLADLETSGVVRARQDTKAGYEDAYFNEGSALGRYKGDVIIEVAPTPKMRRAANGYQVADNVNPITKADAIRIWVRNAETGEYDIAFDNINDVVSRQFRSASGAERGASATVYRGEYARPHDTELPAFKTWFRESAVVDSKGLPLRVYHGTPVGNIEAFDKAASSSRNVLGHGFYFTEDPSIAAQYTTARRSGGEPALADGGAVVPVYLSIQRPLDMGEPLSAAGVAGILTAARRVEGVDVAGLTAALEKAGPVSGGVVWAEIRKATSGGNDAQKAAANAVVRGAGFDGLRSGNTWVIFEPNQAKSAVGNRGTFSLTDDRFLYSRAPSDAPDVAAQVVLRNKGERAGAEGIDRLSTPGKLYRGMTEAEYVATVGKDGHVRSRQDYSVPGEGTSFSDSFADAESYVDFGRDDPRITGRPNYIVEVDRGELSPSSDGYFKAPAPVPAGRVWKVVAEDDALVGRPFLYSRAPGNQTDTPAFRAFIAGTKAVDESGAPKRLYHGTTHEFDAFNPTLANVENHHGRGIYLTSSAEDVGANYATRQGADIKSRIESRHEEMVDVWDDPDEARGLVDEWAAAHPERKADADVLRAAVDDPEAVSAGPRLLDEVTRWKAEQQIAGSHGGAVLPVYAAIKNPVDLRPGKVTRFDIETKWSEDGEDFLGEEGLGVQAKEAIQRVANDYDDSNLADEVLEALDDPEGFTAADLEQAVRRLGSDWYADGERSSPGQFLQDVYREMGFDGIVVSADKEFGAGRKFGQSMPGINPDTEHWVAFKPTQVKSATGNVGTWNPNDPRHLYQRVDTAAPKAPGILVNPDEAQHLVGYARGATTPSLHARTISDLAGFGDIRLRPLSVSLSETEATVLQRMEAGATDKAIRDELGLSQKALDKMREPDSAVMRAVEERGQQVVDHLASNLVWLVKSLPKEMVDGARGWYTGARSLSQGWALRYGRSRKEVAAVLAALSPNTEWFTNVSQAERLLDIHSTKMDHAWDAAMEAVYLPPTLQIVRSEIVGKALKDVKGALQRAAWMVAYDVAHNGNVFRQVNPDGTFGAIVRNASDGEATKFSWQYPENIAKAVEIMDNPTQRVIYDNLGWRHKVRSFYNNIFDPLHPAKDVTIDTHAMAAAWLRPLGGKAPEVFHGFEKGSSTATGHQGSYYVYTEAYAKAAKELGLHPSELQSVAWEGAKGLLRNKSAKSQDVAKSIWKEYVDGRITADVARERIAASQGGRESPFWLKSDREVHDPAGTSSYAERLPVTRDAVSERLSRDADSRGGIADSGRSAAGVGDWTPTPGRTTDVLAGVVADGGDEALSAVAKHLIDTRGDDLAGVVVRTDADLPSQAVGRYNPAAKVIDLADTATPKTVVHEAIHVVTHDAITNPHLYSPAVQKAVRNLEQLHGLVRRIPGIEDMGRIYGLKNTDEFVAEAMSSPEFQTLLREVKVTVKDGEIVLGTGGGSSRSLWDSFVSTMAKIIGFSDTDALGHVLSNTQTIIREAGGAKTVILAADTSPWATKIREAAMAVKAKSPTTDFAWLVEHPSVGGATKEVEAYKAALAEAGMDPRVVPDIEGVTTKGDDFLYARQKGSTRAPFRGVDGKPRTATMFSGGGLVEVGLRGRVDPVFAVEANADIGSHYKAAHGDHVRIDDVRNVDIGEAGDIDYLHASPVCKNFSAAKIVTEAGEQPLDIETATATAAAIRKTKPRVFTLENVKGYQGSEAMKIIEDALRDEGYTFDARVYDAADYGAATHRQRLLLRAVKDGPLPAPPTPTHGAPLTGQPYADWYATVEDIVDGLPDETPVPPWARDRLVKRGIDAAHPDRPIIVMGGSAGSTTVPYAFEGGPAPTFKATPGELHRIVLPDGRVKRVTPQVMARITGLPDDYPLPKNAALATTIIGNGVPPALSKAVFGSLLDDAAEGAKKADDFLYAPPSTPSLSAAIGIADIQREFGIGFNDAHALREEWKKAQAGVAGVATDPRFAVITDLAKKKAAKAAAAPPAPTSQAAASRAAAVAPPSTPPGAARPGAAPPPRPPPPPPSGPPGTPPRPVQYSATPMRGSLDGAIKAETAARVRRASSQHAALGLAEGLRRVASLATSVGGKPAVLTPAEAAAYAERLFDSASTTARELALGAEEAIVPAGSKGAIRALVESVMAAPPTPATQALVSAVEAADAARRMFTGERLEKALRAVTPRVDKAFRDVMQAGVAVTPAQRAAFRDAAVLELEGTLIGKNSLARAEAAIDKVLATAPVDQITPQMMGDVDEVMRTYATEAAESARRANPLRSSAPSILLGESASRFRGVKDNPTLLRGLKNGLVKAVKLVFVGGNEMAPWAKEGLSKEAREWTLAAVRRFDAIAGDVSQLKSADEAAAYLHGVAAPANRGLVTDGMDRFDVFTNLVTVDRKSVDEYLDALMATEMKPKNLAEQINGAGVAGRPEQAGAQYPFWMEVQAAIEAARAGKIDAAGFMERLHKVAKPYTRNGEVPEAWTRVTTGWIAAQAENVVLLNKGFGDGIVFTRQDVDAIRALGDGKFDSDTMRALDPANMVERAVSSNRMVGVGGLEGRTEKVGELTVQVGGADAVAGARKHARAAERIGVYNAVMADQIYVPRLVREQMAGAIARTFTPQTYGGNNMLGVWKLANTRGVLASKPGYILNNMPGDTEQIMLATGMRVALKTAVRAEGASVASILVTALPSMAGHAARAVVGDVAGPVVQSVVQGGVDFGLGVFLAATAGKNKGAVARLIHAGGEVGEKLAGKVANMLGMGATRVEISTIMDGGDELVTIGDKVWKARELRRTAIETGVYDSFDRAELVQSVNGLNKLFRVPAEGVSSIAETVSLRKRLALYTVLIEEGMQPKAAGRAVVDALFDYRATLSEGEKHWLRQVLLPFWSWQKNMNRLVINSVASPMGAYRLKVTHQVGEKAKEMMAEAPTTEGDDVGILNTFMLADEVVHYERFRRFRELAEAINPQLTPENWNAIILSSNPGVPVTMEWAQDPTIPEADRLTPRDVEVMRAYLSPWYTESMARSYLRDRAQVRMKHPVTTDGKVVPTETWHAVAPRSGLAGAMEWFSMVAAGTLASGALGIKTVGGPGDWLSMQTPGEALSPLIDPKNAPQLGSLIAVMDPRGRSPQRVAEVIPKTVDAIRDSVAGFLWRSGVADGNWDNATPGVLIDDKSGTVRYTYTPEIAALIGSLPGIADLNRKALSYEGSKGEAYAPDVARILLQSFGFSAPTVENMAGLKEVSERNAWVKKNLPQYIISRGDEGERLITTEAAPK